MKEDARQLSAQAQEEKRKQAIRLHQQGYRYKAIGELVGVHFETVGKWVRRYHQEGLSGLNAKCQGRPSGRGRALSESQEKRIKRMLVDKTPDQLKLSYALWTRQGVQELIETRTGVKLAIRTVGKYLSLWGMTPQKPLTRAYEQRPKDVKKWLDETYPQIKANAKTEGAQIYWADETGLRNDSQHERGYAPKGKTPVIALNVNRVSMNMISAINNQGKVRFQIFDGTMNANILIGFFKRLIKSAQRKVYVILDNLRVHHAKVVKVWLAEHTDQIEVFYLPAYSPELNPDEYLNCDLKGGVHRGKPARTKVQLKNKTLSHMRRLQKKPDRVKKYFNHEKIKYAA